MSETIGIIAGRGQLPFAVAQAARKKGLRLVVGGLYGTTDPELEQEADTFHWFHLGELDALMDAFRSSDVRQAVMVGKVLKTDLYQQPEGFRPDARTLKLLQSLKDRRDDSILNAIADTFAEEGIELCPQVGLVPELLAPEGVLGKIEPSQDQQEDIRFGWSMAKEVARLDIGQTVVVKNRSVVAVESIEGTDAAIRRGSELAEGQVCVVKVSKPSQDPRFDMPTIGLDTLNVLVRNKASVLAFEANETILLDREKVITMANANKIVLFGIKSDIPVVRY